MKTYNLFIGHAIGSDTTAHDTDSIMEALLQAFPYSDFTIIPCIGVYGQMPEPSSMVILATDISRKRLITVITDLARTLTQDCIMLTYGKKTKFIYSY